jgi:hypothetical protein
MTVVKYRLYNPALAPRRTKLEIPGWAGNSEPRANGSHEYAWHCLPFTEAARAGIELFYPHDSEFRVTMRDGALAFKGDTGADEPPFRSFGTAYYTYQLLLDLKVDAEMAIKTEPHPRFYTDTTGTVPIAVPALIRHWWPMIYFVVFKSPSEGQTHIFRPGEPFMQISVVPADDKPELVEMPEDEAAERELQSQRIHASRATLAADSQWTSSTNTVFDGTYRRILAAAKTTRDK